MNGNGRPLRDALDVAADPGNALLRKFEASHRLGVDPGVPVRTKRAPAKATKK